MLLSDAPLTFREFITHEQLPLATIFRQIMAFLGERQNAVLFGAHAVNAYCETERMTQDVDVLSTDARGFAEALRDRLADSFHIAVRIRDVANGSYFRVDQVRQPKNRHLADVRQINPLPAYREIEGLKVAAPVELLAMKVQALAGRQARPKGGTDRADVQRLLLAFPELKTETGPVLERLTEARADHATIELWRELARSIIEPDDDLT